MPQETDRLKLPLPLGNENVTRESINRIFEKIDAGVATRESILIPAESDLNSYITEGEYYCPTNATVGTLANSPVGVAFHLTIEKHAGVVQTLTTFEPSNLQVFQRNYYVGWGPWKKVPTRDDIDEVKVYTDQKVGEVVIDDASLTNKGIVQLSNAVDGTREDLAATEKAVRDARVAAETSAKTYSETNFRKPAQINRANLVKNGSALMAFDYWVPIAGNWAIYSNPTVGYFWSQDGAISEGQYAVLDSNTISVYPGTHFLQAMFHTVGSGVNSLVLIEIKNASTDVTINSLSADRNSWWHRKGTNFNVPEGVSAIKLRLVVSNYPGGSNMGFSRISLNEGAYELPYSQEADIRALYEQNQVVKQSGVDAKKGIVDAINALGVLASTEENWSIIQKKVGSLTVIDDPTLMIGKPVYKSSGTGSGWNWLGSVKGPNSGVFGDAATNTPSELYASLIYRVNSQSKVELIYNGTISGGFSTTVREAFEFESSSPGSLIWWNSSVNYGSGNVPSTLTLSRYVQTGQNTTDNTYYRVQLPGSSGATGYMLFNNVISFLYPLDQTSVKATYRIFRYSKNVTLLGYSDIELDTSSNYDTEIIPLPGGKYFALHKQKRVLTIFNSSGQILERKEIKESFLSKLLSNNGNIRNNYLKGNDGKNYYYDRNNNLFEYNGYLY